MTDSIVIVGAARTPMGGMLGDLSSVPAAELGATAIRAAIERAATLATSANGLFAIRQIG